MSLYPNIEEPERYEEPQVFCPCGCGEAYPDRCSRACLCGCGAMDAEPCRMMPVKRSA